VSRRAAAQLQSRYAARVFAVYLHLPRRTAQDTDIPIPQHTRSSLVVPLVQNDFSLDVWLFIDTDANLPEVLRDERRGPGHVSATLLK
jgi:hypothetical protein